MDYVDIVQLVRQINDESNLGVIGSQVLKGFVGIESDTHGGFV